MDNVPRGGWRKPPNGINICSFVAKGPPRALSPRRRRAWFRDALGEPTRAQTLGWPPVARGESTLLLAPTGSGKTLAAFLLAVDRLAREPEPAGRGRTRVLYVSPLKALAIDVERNLKRPLEGIADQARRMGSDLRPPTVAVRTGDTPAKERTRMVRAPADILITTPESLYLLLTSRAREVRASVDTVIVDEIHALVPTKRGAHRALSLERLESSRPRGAAPLQRIGLSATQRPLDEVARMLGGLDAGEPRPVTIVDAGARKALRLSVESTLDPASAPQTVERRGRRSKKEPDEPARHGEWPALHARIVELARAHRSTLVFVNSRRLAERLAAALNDLAGEELALAHHGSVAREKRADIEDRLKRGDLRAIVATSSLELGIDMGAIDLVVQVESPPSVASGLQRVGRACHEVGGVPEGVLMPKHRQDLVACAAAAADMLTGAVEETFYPRNPLDVLSQQIVAMAAVESMSVEEAYALVRRAAPFADLPRAAFDSVLDMLSGRYPSDDFAELRPRITWDRAGQRIEARTGAHRLAVTNGGTIPDRGLYGVFTAPDAGADGPGRRVGELDEEMVFELREGEVFLLGASSWRAESITHDRVLVSPAPGEPGKMPFWHGDRPGRARAFGERIGRLVRRIAEGRADATELQETHALAPTAAETLVAYVREQVEATGEVPSDRTIVVERFVDEVGDWRVVVLCPLGTRVLAPWAISVAATLRESYVDVDLHYTDDGMAFRIPACETPPPAELFFPRADAIEGMVTRALEGTALFASRFRECAARALLLPRRDPRRRTPLWAQRKRATHLLAIAGRYPEFPIVLEAYRECLRDAFDLPGLTSLLGDVESRRVRVTTVDGRGAVPLRRERPLRLRRQLHLRSRRSPRRAPGPGPGHRLRPAPRAPRRGRAPDAPRRRLDPGPRGAAPAHVAADDERRRSPRHAAFQRGPFPDGARRALPSGPRGRVARRPPRRRARRERARRGGRALRRRRGRRQAPRRARPRSPAGAAALPPRAGARAPARDRRALRPHPRTVRRPRAGSALRRPGPRDGSRDGAPGPRRTPRRGRLLARRHAARALRARRARRHPA